MNSYIDVVIKPQKKIKSNVLLNKVYSQLHLALCEMNSDSIGVSFPKYKVTLGNTIRIHGIAEQIKPLSEDQWVGPLKEYCDVSSVLTVKSDALHRKVSRARPNMTESKLRRIVKRNALSSEEIKAYRVKMFSKGLADPYVELQSSSTGQFYRRFISFGEISAKPTEGEFDSFGLSRSATIPWF